MSAVLACGTGFAATLAPALAVRLRTAAAQGASLGLLAWTVAS